MIQKDYKDIDNNKIADSVIMLDMFTKLFCRYVDDYERFNDLKFRCEDCPFQLEDGKCLMKQFKNKFAPDYEDFGSMVH